MSYWRHCKQKLQHLFKYAHQKTLTGTYTELYRMVEEVAAKAIFLGEAQYENNNKTRELAES